MEGFARMFYINRYRTTTFHPQSSRNLEIMHGSLVEYIKLYTGLKENEYESIVMAAHAHNSSKHEATAYTPFELVRGYKAKILNDFLPKEEWKVYDDYFANLSEGLKELQTCAALNQT